MLKVKVNGEVVVRDGTHSDTQWYEEEFHLDEKNFGGKGVSEGVVRAVIKKGLISARLREKVSGFKRVRTLSIVSMGKVSGGSVKGDGGRLSLVLGKCLEKGCVPENLDQYGSEDAKVSALERALERFEKGGKSGKGGKGGSVEDLGYMD